MHRILKLCEDGRVAHLLHTVRRLTRARTGKKASTLSCSSDESLFHMGQGSSLMISHSSLMLCVVTRGNNLNYTSKTTILAFGWSTRGL